MGKVHWTHSCGFSTGGAISLADAPTPLIVQYSTVPENPLLHANITALRLIGRELLSIEVYIVAIRIFDLFGSCDLDLGWMTIVYELDP